MKIALVFVVLFTSGCAPKAASLLPAYRWTDTKTAIDDLRSRSESIHTVSAECTITLTRPDGKNAQLDGAIVMQNPDFVRLRAWKFNRAVFDLTLTPEGLWVMTMDDSAHEKQTLPASIAAGEFLKQWKLVNGGMFQEPNISADLHHKTLSLSVPPVVCEIDRATLTPREYIFFDETETFSMALNRYVEIDGVLWPTQLIASGTMGTIVIEQRHVEINSELAPNAFVPPRRAEKRK